MPKTFTAACIQLNSQDDLASNINKAETLIKQAAKAGAEFITLPEGAFLMGAGREQSFATAILMPKHPAVLAMVALAKTLKVYILFGVAVKKTPNAKKLQNRSVLVNANGKIVDFYDKIHLFDADIKGGESHTESKNFATGNRAVLAKLPWAKLGMTICYDLRFPNLFRTLSQGGAEIIAVPSAFTYKTGLAHWHVLLRARAIENTCYIIAPAECGHHPKNRHTYGHSLIISPWGEILTEASENKEEFIIAKIDLDKLKEIRKSLPSLKHDRFFKIY